MDVVVTIRALRRAKLQSSRFYQTNIQLFLHPSCRPNNSVRGLKGDLLWVVNHAKFGRWRPGGHLVRAYICALWGTSVQKWTPAFNGNSRSQKSVMWSETVSLRTRPAWDQKIGLGLGLAGLVMWSCRSGYVLWNTVLSLFVLSRHILVYFLYCIFVFSAYVANKRLHNWPLLTVITIPDNI